MYTKEQLNDFVKKQYQPVVVDTFLTMQEQWKKALDENVQLKEQNALLRNKIQDLMFSPELKLAKAVSEFASAKIEEQIKKNLSIATERKTDCLDSCEFDILIYWKDKLMKRS